MPYPSSTLYPKSSGLYPGAGVPEVPEVPDSPVLTRHGAVEKLQPGRYMLRHVGPQASSETAPGVYKPLGAGQVVLGQTLYGDPLPQTRNPSSPDFHEGKYTLRMFDTGEFSLSFPNKDASDGQPWRNRFDPTGHREFVEIAREAEPEFIGVIAKRTANRQQVTIEGYDGLFLLKKAFEQDWTGVMAPRDVIEKYSRLWVVTKGDGFPAGQVGSPYFTFFTTAGGPIAGSAYCEVAPEGGVRMGIEERPKEGGATAEARVSTTNPVTLGGDAPWRFVVPFTVKDTGATNLPWEVSVKMVKAAIPVREMVRMRLRGYSATGVQASLFWRLSTGEGPSESILVDLDALTVPGGNHTMVLESDGRWLRAFVDGILIAIVPDPFSFVAPMTVNLQMSLNVENNWGAGEAAGKPIIGQDLFVPYIAFRQLQPYMMRGGNPGEFVLPGTPRTYPTGGLHGRYSSYGGAGEPWWHWFILAPDPRKQGYPDFVQTTEAFPPKTSEGEGFKIPPGTTTKFFARRLFGAIYLKLSGGNFPMIVNPVDGCRIWIGQTRWGQQLVENWIFAAWRNINFTVNAAALGAKDGWYPIIIEQMIGEGSPLLGLYFTPPVTYTDPGGTVLNSGAQVLVPPTSLSPLGCVDARIQGSSHFDIVNETARNSGYQVRCEPRTLETGEFPGCIIPKARQGFDTDEVIEAGDLDRRSEISNYSQTLDATDIASSVKAFGSGIADGKGSQVAYEATSMGDELADLFDIQAWVSAGDIAFPQLLASRANAELGLRTGAWENVEGEPIARDRIADTFPLTGSLSQFRWQPGDGVRLRLPDVNIEDTACRQILQVTREFSPEGRTNTSVGFRSRPKDPLTATRNAIREATRPARAFQGQYVTRVSEHIGSLAPPVAAGGFSAYGMIPLLGSDKVVSAQIILSLVTVNKKVGIEIEGTMATSQLGGPWTYPVAIDILTWAKPNKPEDQRLYFRFKNEDVAEAIIQGQLIVTLLV